MNKYFLFVAIAFYSCSKSRQDPAITNTGLDDLYIVLSDTVKLPIDYNTSVVNTQYQLLSKENYTDLHSDILVIFNRIEYRFQLYDLDSLTLIETINLDMEGPNSVHRLDHVYSNFYFDTLDSIYFLSSDMEVLYLLNGAGKKINEIGLEFNNDNIFPQVSDKSPLLKYKNKLIFSTYSSFSEFGGYTSESFGKSHLFSYDLLNHHIESMNMGLPKDYLIDKWVPQDYFYSMAVNPVRDEIVIAMPMSHDVNVFKLDGFEKHNAQSEYADITPPKRKERSYSYAGSFDPMIRYKMLNAVYLKLVSSKELGLIFREVRHQLSEEEFLNGPPFNVKSSVVILDSNYERLGELPTPNCTYMFVSSDGELYVSPGEMLNDEDNIYFIRYKFIRK